MDWGTISTVDGRTGPVTNAINIFKSIIASGIVKFNMLMPVFTFEYQVLRLIELDCTSDQ